MAFSRIELQPIYHYSFIFQAGGTSFQIVLTWNQDVKTYLMYINTGQGTPLYPLSKLFSNFKISNFSSYDGHLDVRVVNLKIQDKDVHYSEFENPIDFINKVGLFYEYI